MKRNLCPLKLPISSICKKCKKAVNILGVIRYLVNERSIFRSQLSARIVIIFVPEAALMKSLPSSVLGV